MGPGVEAGSIRSKAASMTDYAYVPWEECRQCGARRPPGKIHHSGGVTYSNPTVFDPATPDLLAGICNDDWCAKVLGRPPPKRKRRRKAGQP